MNSTLLKNYKGAVQPRSHTPATSSMGARVTPGGTHFRVWAPTARNVEVLIFQQPEILRRHVPLRSLEAGWFEGLDRDGRAGDRYKLRLDEKIDIPDPLSHWQPEGPHGPSVVVDPSAFQWSDAGWRRPALRSLVIYELHVGTFTPEGTFAAAKGRLPHLKELGVTAVELMPLAECTGERNWGYDGVCLFAPFHPYGPPDDLRAFVNEAHRQGIAVLLDVVYNHFGPDGCYLNACIGDYLDESAKTPWGGAIRYGDAAYSPLRQMLVANVQYWMRDFHIDGFRLDAVHAIRDESAVHVLQEVTAAVHAAGGFVIAEDNRNDASICEHRQTGGMGFDAVWADDFHHVLRVSQTRESAGYYQDYSGNIDELLEVMRAGWLYQGQLSKSTGTQRGTRCDHLRPPSFVTCISNHDQVGNRAFGERLHHVISPEAYRALSALVCLCPFTPMLFMGQEWAASSPFLYFTDHEPGLGALVTTGRRGEFAAFPEFQGEGTVESIPDPQAVDTFERSKLRWDEIAREPHAQTLALYRECLSLRRRIPLLSTDARRGWRLEKLPGDLLVIHYYSESHCHTVIAYLGNAPVTVPVVDICPAPEFTLALSSNEDRFGGDRG
ncbi:MAG: treZ, partial [Prosthecobacter sp.]|nr:treZ [Prosthecobacter sp.]